MESVDLIVNADYVLTMNQDLAVIESGAIAIKDKKIVAVDTAAQITQTVFRLKDYQRGGQGRIPRSNKYPHPRCHGLFQRSCR